MLVIVRLLAVWKVDERRRPELADGLFCLPIVGRAAAGACELAERPQQQKRLVRYPYLADAGLTEPGQLRQQLVTRL